MQNEREKNLDRGRLAATKWLPMSAIGAAIPFVIGVVMRLPVEQVLVSACSHTEEKDSIRVLNKPSFFILKFRFATIILR
jgi:hypothetical protein